MTQTTWYTDCGYYKYNVSRTVFLETESKPKKWRPLAAVFFVTEGGLLDGAVEGVNGFLERYAACGLSK